ncbi:hypothetical protein [Bdellovibrio sp. HCB209]|uniref:hypothetical protein n=1 Tax=Bdellovibrio sp. HCB209 TaxID=3394354 RepID=UPI0039B60A7C
MKKFVVLFLLIHFVCFSLARAADSASPEIIFFEKNAAGVEEVVFRDQHSTQVLGELQTLPKGTRLYHWEKATASQIKSWNAEGKISAERLEKLKGPSREFSGGGYYVSLSPLDSVNYGNTVVIVELPKDIKILKLYAPLSWSANGFRAAVEKKGISVLTVPHTPTWMNLFDAEALTNIHVGTEKDFVDFKFDGFERPWNYEKFFELFPGLKNSESLSSASEKMTSIYKSLKKPSEEARLAVEAIVKTGSMNLVTDVFKKASAENISMKAIKDAVDGYRYASMKELYKTLKSDPEKLNYALSEGMRSDYFFLSNSAITALASAPLSVSQRTLILQKFEERNGGNINYQARALINSYKMKPGQWLPHQLCSAVFN